MNGDCEYVVDGTDTDGTIWYRCTTHNELAPSDEAPCAGYVEIPYSNAELNARWDRAANAAERGLPDPDKAVPGWYPPVDAEGNES